jgi:hypothetical protein
MANASVSTKWRVETVSTERLRYDPLNPRFTEGIEAMGRDEETTIRFLYDQVDLSELITSISEVGFIDLEPLIVLREDEHYTVLEGNRRLAAIRLLQQRELQRKLGLELPKLDPDKAKSLAAVSVWIVDSREDARAYIGFKHINGPHKWDSLAKAKYAVRWFEEGGDLVRIARSLGDTHNTVRRLVNGWFVLEQARNVGFDIDDRTAKHFAFSHLYTALPRPGYRSWLSLSPDDPSKAPRKNPVPKGKIDHLLTLMSWLYGQQSKDEPPLIRSQNPDLNKLNDVLQKTQARTLLLERRDLDGAYELVEPPIRRFEGTLVLAAKFAEDALALSAAYNDDPALLETGRGLAKTARNLVTIMEQAADQTEQD